MAQWTTTYNDLVSRLEEYCEDDSSEFSSNVEGCINRAEERVLNDLDIGTFNFRYSATTSNGSQIVSLPDATAPVESVYFTSAGEHADRRSLDFVQAYGGSGRPLYYAVDDTSIIFAPTPDAAYAYVVTQMARPTPLSSSNQTNWLTTNAADILLWASLIEAEAFLLAPERVAEFQAYYAARLGPLRALWRKDRQMAYEPLTPTPEPVRDR